MSGLTFIGTSILLNKGSIPNQLVDLVVFIGLSANHELGGPSLCCVGIIFELLLSHRSGSNGPT